MTGRGTAAPPRAAIDALLDLQRRGEHRALIDAGRQLDAAHPGSAFVQMLLGITHARLGEQAEMLDRFERAAALAPDDAETQHNLGAAYDMAGRFEAAAQAYHRAIALRPGHAPSRLAHAEALRRSGRAAAAIDAYRALVAVAPGHAVAFNNLGNLLLDAKRLDQAIDAYSRALAIDPDYAPARAHRRHAAALMCDWDRVAADAGRVPRLGVEGAAVPPFMMLAAEDHPLRHRRRAERRIAEQFPAAAARPTVPARPRAARAERLRIGYLSADLHDHATMRLMARLFELHDRDRFAVHAYSYGPDADDAMRRRLLGAVEHFQDIRTLGDRDAAALLRRDGIDVAVDLKGHTAGNRLGILAERPAPVQVHYLGHPGTIGAPFVDYLVGDPVVTPARLRDAYAEKLILLPHSYMCSDDRRPIAATTIGRAQAGLPDRGFVFACFNNSYKIDAALFDIWMRLLGAVEGSVLWLLRANPWVADNLGREAAKRGVDPARLIFADPVAPAEHLARHRLADLSLDCFAFNAHTTASDALWSGLPLVTCAGESFSARVAASLLTAAGLPELIADSPAGYERLALALATDPAALAAIRAKLAAQRQAAPLFDSARHTRHLEAGFAAAFHRHAQGLPPDHIEIAP